MNDLNKTPLCEVHQQLNAKMVDFNGWLMPVQYTGIIPEHQCVRNQVGLFDISHMGTFWVSGLKAFDFLQTLLPNDLTKLTPGKGLYTQFCRDDGGILDDLIVYQIAPQIFQLIVNAGNRIRDFQWLDDWLDTHQRPGIALQDMSSETCILALQGPKAVELLTSLVNIPLAEMPAFGIQSCQLKGISLTAARTGYTGEDGFELFVPTNQAVTVWEQLMEAGQSLGIQPIGLGARDTLRLEAAMPLYGHDLTIRTTPMEAGLGWSVALNKPVEFVGKPALMLQKTHGVQKKRVGFRLPDTKRAPRQGYRMMLDGQQIGEVTSGSLAPTLNESIGMGYVVSPWYNDLTHCDIEIRGQLYPAEMVKLPFYRRKK